MPRLLTMLMGRANVLMAPIDDTANGREFENQFDGADPDDSDIPGSDNDGTLKDGAAAPAAAPAPAAPAPAPAAPAPAPATEDDPDAAPPAAAPSPAPAPAAEAPAPAAAPAAEAPAAAPPAPEPYVPEARAPRFEAPADAQAQIDTARTKRDDAFAKFEEGELTREEYKAIEKETLATEQKLQSAITRDEAVRAVLQTQAETLYDEKRADAINTLVAAGISATKENLEEFDTLTASYGDLAGRRGMVDGPKLVASQWALDSAVKAFKAAHGVASAPAAPAPAPAAPAAAPAAATPAAAPAGTRPTQAQAEAERKPDLSKLPPTLANTPAAADANVAGNKFAHVDAMSRMDQEKAVAAMSDAELNEYLSR